MFQYQITYWHYDADLGHSHDWGHIPSPEVDFSTEIFNCELEAHASMDAWDQPQFGYGDSYWSTICTVHLTDGLSSELQLLEESYP